MKVEKVAVVLMILWIVFCINGCKNDLEDIKINNKIRGLEERIEKLEYPGPQKKIVSIFSKSLIKTELNTN